MVIIQRGIEREIPCGHPLFYLDDVALFDVKITGKVFVLRFALTVRLQGFSHFSNLIEKLLLERWADVDWCDFKKKNAMSYAKGIFTKKKKMIQSLYINSGQQNIRKGVFMDLIKRLIFNLYRILSIYNNVKLIVVRQKKTFSTFILCVVLEYLFKI